MNSKLGLITVLIIAILVALSVAYKPRKITQSPVPTSTPISKEINLDEELTNLDQEINTQTSGDFSVDF